MNLQRLITLREHLSTPKAIKQFNMSTVLNNYVSTLDDKNIAESFHTCGTVGCIAAHTLYLFKPELQRYCGMIKEATTLLGLNTYQAETLFSRKEKFCLSWMTPKTGRMCSHREAMERLDKFIELARQEHEIKTRELVDA